jgi:hypothetical protein
MAYPPSTIAADKNNGTLTEDDHAPHHNDLAEAVNDIVDELGPTPAADIAGAQADATTAQGDIDTHKADTNDAHDASAISFSPTGGLAGTDVQTVLAELDTEKQPDDADLTAIAALTTTAYGRALLELADQAALTAAIAAATTTLSGAAELATRVEAAAGTDTSRIVTPDGVAGALGARVGAMGPTGSLGETFDRAIPHSSQNHLVSGRLGMYAAWLPAGHTVANISFMSGTQATVSGTHLWFGLFDSGRVALRLTADDTAASPWGANTVKTIALTSSFVTTYSGLHYLGVMSAAGTVPNLFGATVVTTGPMGLAPIRAGFADTGLTTPPSLPFTAAALAAAVAYAYAWVT